MSVTICWRPIHDEDENDIDGTSTTLNAIGLLAGYGNNDPPYLLTRAHVGALRALATIDRSSTWDSLLEALEDHDKIEVWGEW